MRIVRIGPFQLNADLLKLTAGTAALPVGPKVVETLLALIELAPEVATKEALIARIWPDGFTGEPNLSQNIYVLRKLFRAHGLPDAIETETGAALGNIAAGGAAFARFASVAPYYRPQAAAMLARAEVHARRIEDAQREFAYARTHARDVDDVDLAAAAKALGDFQFAQEIDRQRVAHVSWNAVEDAHRFAVEDDLRAGS